MNPSPKWHNGKLCCQHASAAGGICWREMFVRGKSAVCENVTHGGVFAVPERPTRFAGKDREYGTAEQAWKSTLPLARSRFRRDIRNDGPRHSIGIWRVAGDAEHAWTPVRFDVRQDDSQSCPANCIVAKFRTTGKASRTVLLKMVEISDKDKQDRHWERD